MEFCPNIEVHFYCNMCQFILKRLYSIFLFIYTLKGIWKVETDKGWKRGSAVQFV